MFTTSILVVMSMAMLAAPVEPAQLAADQQVRVYVGGVDPEVFERLFHPPLVGGPFDSAARRTDIGRTIVMESQSDIFQVEEEARRQFAGSAAFELVSSLERAQYVMVIEADYIADSPRRRMRGVLKLVDTQTGEDAYRRRVDLADISSRSVLNRELTSVVNLIGEWAATAVH